MEDEFSRETEPAASLDPPSKKPPTAIATADAPGPDNPGRALPRVRASRSGSLGRWVNAVLDTVDVAADLARDTLLSLGRR
ncbi:MAG TPA: hypothetical protein VEB19_10140 [Gemmatimonadaceae bacterium]|nr:hypothetical protein [Gemmatimonadaceae bacterium]